MSLELTKAGFATVTTSMKAIGSEARDWGYGEHADWKQGYDDFVGYSIFHGTCAMAVWSRDILRIAAAFVGQPEYDSGRFAVAGISHGGEVSLYAGAIDDTFQAVCAHGALASYQDIYTRAHNWGGHAIPGAIGSFDMGDAGIACWPRSLQVQVGEKEPESWGRMQPSALSEFGRISSFYDGNGAKAELRVTPGAGHGFDAPAAIGFLKSVFESGDV